MRTKIGIGVTGYKRPEHLRLCLSQIEKHTKNYKLHIAGDVPNVAQAKNECLWALQDCDHIFLFDEDCFPVKDQWVDFFIKSKHEYALYLTEMNRAVSKYTGDLKAPYEEYEKAGGCFMYLQKELFKKVGYFNPKYGQYGHEHIGYSERIAKALIIPNPYLSLVGSKEYLYSLDYQGEGDWGIKHRQSITDIKAMAHSVRENYTVLQEERQLESIYIDFKPTI